MDSTNSSRFWSGLVYADQFCDFIPGLSLVSNIVDVIAREVLKRNQKSLSGEMNQYYSHLLKKNIGCCLILATPVVGTIYAVVSFVYNLLYDSKTFINKPIQKALHLPQMQKKLPIISDEVWKNIDMIDEVRWSYVEDIRSDQEREKSLVSSEDLTELERVNIIECANTIGFYLKSRGSNYLQALKNPYLVEMVYARNPGVLDLLDQEEPYLTSKAGNLSVNDLFKISRLIQIDIRMNRTHHALLTHLT